MPPIDHWSIGRPHGAPLGLQVSVSDVATGSDAEPVAPPRMLVTGEVTPPSRPATVPGRPPAAGAVLDSVLPAPPAPAADGAELVSVPPAPKYSRVGVAPVNGYVEVSSN